MSSKKGTQHGGEPSGIRKSARKPRQKQRQSLSPYRPTTSNIQAGSQSTTKLQPVVDEKVLSLSRLKPSEIKPDSAMCYVLNQEEHNIDQIMTDDLLDLIQWECESMLSDVLVRKKQIKTDSSLISSLQENGSQNKVENNCKQPMTLPKVAAEIIHDDESSSNDVEYENDPSENEDLPPNQTETTKKFWSLVKSYLADVSKEDLKWLKDLVMSYNSKLGKIPPLGEHYSKLWAQEEMQNQQASSSRQPNMKPRLAERVSPDVVELITRANNAASSGNKSTPVYQKVIAAILEHSNMSQRDIGNDSEIDSDTEDDKPVEMSNVCEEFYGEQNIMKQLETLGLIGNQGKQGKSSSSLPHSSSQTTDDNDEILDELVKCDAELNNLREMNKNHLTILLERCKKRHSQQKQKNKLQKLDNQILNFKKKGKSQKKKMSAAQKSKEYEDMKFLLGKRSDYLKRLQSCTTNPTNSDDSELSDEDMKSDECIVISDSE